jgi:hypothetical protein
MEWLKTPHFFTVKGEAVLIIQSYKQVTFKGFSPSRVLQTQTRIRWSVGWPLLGFVL